MALQDLPEVELAQAGELVSWRTVIARILGKTSRSYNSGSPRPFFSPVHASRGWSIGTSSKVCATARRARSMRVFATNGTRGTFA
jgi:hypothetical protein